MFATISRIPQSSKIFSTKTVLKISELIFLSNPYYRKTILKCNTIYDYRELLKIVYHFTTGYSCALPLLLILFRILLNLFQFSMVAMSFVIWLTCFVKKQLFHFYHYSFILIKYSFINPLCTFSVPFFVWRTFNVSHFFGALPAGPACAGKLQWSCFPSLGPCRFFAQAHVHTYLDTGAHSGDRAQHPTDLGMFLAEQNTYMSTVGLFHTSQCESFSSPLHVSYLLSCPWFFIVSVTCVGCSGENWTQLSRWDHTLGLYNCIVVSHVLFLMLFVMGP